MKNIYIILISIIPFISCNRDEFLDIQPVGKIMPSKTKDFRLLLDFYSNTSGGGVNPPFGDSYIIDELLSDDYNISDNLSKQFSKSRINAYTWADDIFAPDQEDSDWATLYGQIYTCNYIIEEVMNSTGGTEQNKRQLLAEAKVHRAYAYFALVNLYGLQYNQATSSTDLAVPLRLGTELENVNLARVSVKVLYDFILKETLDAINDLPDLPESSSFKHRPSKSGVYGLLARMYLIMGDYTNAFDNADKSLLLSRALLNYNTLGIYFSTLLNMPFESRDDQEALWVKLGAPYSLKVSSPELYNLYEKEDLRKGNYLPIDELYGIPGKDYVYAPPAVTGYPQIGISTPEMFLTRAECYARKGNVSLAIQDLNTLRKARIKTSSYRDLTASTPADALNLVKTERRKEMAFKGVRFFDLKRYNQFDNANINITRSLNGATYALSSGSKNWALPVARKYILQSPEISKNVRD
jgi:hypothetical protein